MNQKELNKYLKYMTSLSDKDREALYSKANGFSFSKEEVSRRLKEPLKRQDKSPYREIELSGWWNDVFAPQATITKLTENNTVNLGNGITMKICKRKKKMEYKEVSYKGEIRRRWIQISSNNPSNLCNEILYHRIVEDMKNEGKEVTMEMVQKIAETWENNITSHK